MKNILFVSLMIMLFFTACGNREGSFSRDLTPEFFSEKLKGEITVSVYDALWYKTFLEEAARAFEELNPGVKVHIDCFSSIPEMKTIEQDGMTISYMEYNDDPQSRADYISRVNTRIMSSQGADIYAMDILPLHKLIKSGSLENLDVFMDNDPQFNRDDYRQNIFDAVRLSGSSSGNFTSGTFFLPLDYSFNYYAYDSSLLPADASFNFGIDRAYSLKELLESGMSVKSERYKLFNARDPFQVFGMLLREDFHSFADVRQGRAKFTDGRFASLLETAAFLGEQGLLQDPLPNMSMEEMIEMFLRGGGFPQEDKFLFKQLSGFSLVSHVSFANGLAMANSMGESEDDEIAGISASPDGSVPFKYSQAYAINSRSNNKAAAWAFLKFLLSEEMQLSPNLSFVSFPVNNKARDEKASFVFAQFSMGEPEIEFNSIQLKALEELKAAVETMSEHINAYVYEDSSLYDMIIEEVRMFFNGTRTAEEVARLIQNKADLYLSE